MRKIILILLSLVMVTVAVNSCKTFTANTYKGLSVTGDIGAESMKVIMTLYKQKVITENEYATAREIYVKYQYAYLTAVEALAAYKAVETKDSQAKLVAAFAELSKISSTLSNMLVKFQAR